IPTVVTAARKLWGLDSLEPDYAVVQNSRARQDLGDEVFRRLQEQGDAKRMLEVLPRLYPEAAERLKGILLARQPLPVEEAKTVVAGPDVRAAGVAAHLLGRAGATDAGPTVAKALGRWWKEWDEKRQEEIRRGVRPGTWSKDLAEPLESLVWAAGRLDALEPLIPIATTRADRPSERPLRREAVAAMVNGKPNKKVLAAL